MSAWLGSSMGMFLSPVRKTSRKNLTGFQKKAAGILGTRDFLMQPGPSVVPPTVRRRKGNSQAFGRFLHRQAGKIAEVDDLGFPGVLCGQLFQGCVQR